MNLTQLIKARDELTAEADRLYNAAESLDEVIATLQPKAKPRRKAPPERKIGILESVVLIVKKKPGITSADILERVKGKQERKSTYNAIYSATSRGVFKKDAKGGLTYVGE